MGVMELIFHLLETKARLNEVFDRLYRCCYNLLSLEDNDEIIKKC